MNMAIIPARGGSKRIPCKNIMAGRPMISYAIAAARSCGLFEHIVVSTDDAEIADVARSFGAEIPFLRPLELADDHTPTIPVIAHAITACGGLGWKIGKVCCIYAATPFLRVEDLRGALQLLEDSGSDFAFPVAEYPSALMILALSLSERRGESGTARHQ